MMALELVCGDMLSNETDDPFILIKLKVNAKHAFCSMRI